MGKRQNLKQELEWARGRTSSKSWNGQEAEPRVTGLNGQEAEPQARVGMGRRQNLMQEWEWARSRVAGGRRLLPSKVVTTLLKAS